jgi:hypothetical protein
MPVEGIEKIPRKDAEGPRLVIYDKRQNPDLEGLGEKLGFNGFANLIFTGARLSIEYKDIKDRHLIEEIWEVDLNHGMHGVSIQLLEKSEGLAPVESVDLEEAIR